MRFITPAWSKRLGEQTPDSLTVNCLYRLCPCNKWLLAIIYKKSLSQTAITYTDQLTQGEYLLTKAMETDSFDDFPSPEPVKRSKGVILRYHNQPKK